LRVSPGAKVNSGRCEHIGGSAIWGISRQANLNNSPICAAVLREIRDLHDMIARHSNFKNRIVALDDLALKRIGEGNCCGSKENRSDEKSRGERFHDSTDKHDSDFGYQNRRGQCSML
jgi:hypothetical protein